MTAQTDDSIATALAHAWAEHQAGRSQAAEQGYRQVLGLDQDNPDALHLLGVLTHQAGRHREAIGLIARAVQQWPTNAAYFSNLGEAHRALGELDQAIACQRQALALDPTLAAAHNNYGLTLEARGQADAARASYREALHLAPDLADAWINVGNLLAADGQIVEATEHFERAIRLAPGTPAAHFNLANALREQGLVGPAAERYRRTLELQPGHLGAANNLGLVLLAGNDWPAAVACFDAVLRRAPRHAETHNNRGLALEAMGDLEGARQAYRRAIEAEPGLAQAHNNLGRALHRLGDEQAAIVSLRRALQLHPDYVEAHTNLGHVLKDSGRLDESIGAFLKAVEEDDDHADSTAQLVYQLQQQCDWARLAQFAPRIDVQSDRAIAEGRRPGETPFGSLARGSDPARHLAIARAWAAGIEERVARSGRRFDFAGRGTARDRLRIGYLSCDFRDHPVAHQMHHLMAVHDRADFEVWAYGYGPPSASPERARIVASCDAFVDLAPLSDQAAAEQIFADEVDILVDLGGYTKDNRIQIAAFRPAPVQVSYLGFPGTSGGRFLDYVITDRICVPPDEACHFTEQPVHMPESFMVLGETTRPENRYRRLDFGLPDHGFVFCSLNAAFKIEPVMFEVWMQLLRQVPDSVLWLYRGSEVAVRHLEREARAHGIQGRRLVFADRVPYDDNLARLQLADLSLDTRVYNGGLTTANALFAGVPVVTLYGSDWISRMGASMLHGLELPDLVADSLGTYHDLALGLARDPDRREALRARLAERLTSAPLFDTARFARHLEAAYREMWRRHLAGEAPRPIAVDGC